MMRFTSRSKHETCLNPVYPTRQWQCPHCETRFEAAMRAVTLKCPSCAKPIQFQDVVFNRTSAETLTTLGTVRITRRGSVQGNISCGELFVEGTMSGTVHVRGRAMIGNKAAVSGTVQAHALTIDAGGRLRGMLDIAPPPDRSSNESTSTSDEAL